MKKLMMFLMVAAFGLSTLTACGKSEEEMNKEKYEKLYKERQARMQKTFDRLQAEVDGK